MSVTTGYSDTQNKALGETPKPLNHRIGNWLDVKSSQLLGPLDDDITFGFKEIPLFTGVMSMFASFLIFIFYAIAMWPFFKSYRVLTRKRREAEAVFNGMSEGQRQGPGSAI